MRLFNTYLEKNVVLPEGFDGLAYLREKGNKFVPVSVQL